MKTKLDELLEKWRDTEVKARLLGYPNSAEHVSDCIRELTAIKHSLNDPVDEPPTKPLPLTEHEKCLEAWMWEVTDFLISQQAFNLSKVGKAFAAYRKSIGKHL